MSDEGKPKTIEEIMADIAEMRANLAAMSGSPPVRIPDGTRVKLSEAAHVKLGDRRARDPSVMGTVSGWDARQNRALVVWDGSTGREPLAPAYLEAVS